GGESQALDGGSEARNSDTGGESQASGGGAQPVKSGSGGKASGSGSTGPGQAPSSASDIEKGEGDENSRCPGHLDLSIHITIKGLRERASLYEADPLNPSLESSPGDWQGWNDTARGWVETLDSQDWYGLYGLNTTALLMGNPLTSSEIDTYMSMLPDDASPMRRAFVKYALTSVGKIPYYWGGKPTAPGYTGNDFGSVMTPDEDGRFLRGLDCSGWVNWVYWSVTGRGLGSESTGTLVGSGTAVSKSQLIPGDICIRTGPVGHVVIFLGWTADGKMLCIQETTGNANNVEVGIVASDWNSYRRIID
ncbi:MAG: NlpC/P60 family protein, partial [Clostridium sp.]|nr:NlpC/P60 family protein [Clostridium sp.]